MDINPNSPITMTCFTVVTLEAIAGIVMNLFMLIVLLQQFFREKGTYSGDVIRIGMIRSSMFLTLVLISFLFCYIFFPNVFIPFRGLFNAITVYSMGSSLYFTALYCFFLFIKIVQFKLGVLVWVKRNVKLVFPRLMVAVEVFSLCCGFLSFVFFDGHGDVYTNSTTVSTANVKKGRNVGQQMSFLLLAVFLVAYFLMAVTIISAAVSLLLHSHRMKITGTVNTETYKNTVRKMMNFFIYHTLLCLVLFLFYFSDLSSHASGFWTLLIMIFLVSPARSVILIYSDPKWRNAWKKLIHGIGN